MTSSTLYRPDGYSGGGRLDVWASPTRAAALLDGARLAMASGLEDDPRAVALFEKGRYQAVLDRCEKMNPDTHLLRVQPALLHDDSGAEPDR